MEHKEHAEYSQPSKDRLFVHEFDGIQEYDNPLPGWWKAIFWATFVFALVYIVHYHNGLGTSVKQEYAVAIKEIKTIQAEYKKKMAAKTSGKALEKFRGNAQMISAGEKIYATNCSLCHGKKGEGLVGPNLTDNYWIFGPGLGAIYNVVRDGGREGKGMRAWQGTLSVKQMQEVVVYIASLNGTNPPNPKPRTAEEKFFPPAKRK